MIERMSPKYLERGPASQVSEKNILLSKKHRRTGNPTLLNSFKSLTRPSTTAAFAPSFRALALINPPHTALGKCDDGDETKTIESGGIESA